MCSSDLLDQVTNIVPVIHKVLGGDAGRTEFLAKSTTFIPDFDTPRFRLTPRHAAYIKIAEGCNHPCSFCIIPKIRGRQESRSVASLVEEARRLAGSGVRELCLIAQDLTSYGHDRDDGADLRRLLEALLEVEGIDWFRLL